LKILGVYISLLVIVLGGLGLASEVQAHMDLCGHGILTAIVITLAWFMLLVNIPGLREHIDAWVEWFAGRSEQKRAKREPVYGDPNDTRYLTGDDRPLPPELRYRVAVYVGRRKSEDASALDSDLAAASSFNALVREEIEDGRL
jgi:hypothetical protein